MSKYSETLQSFPYTLQNDKSVTLASHLECLKTELSTGQDIYLKDRRMLPSIYLHSQVPGGLQKELLAQVVAQTHATLAHCTNISIIAITGSVSHGVVALRVNTSKASLSLWNSPQEKVPTLHGRKLCTGSGGTYDLCITVTFGTD